MSFAGAVASFHDRRASDGMSATVKPVGGRRDVFLALEYVDGDAESALRRALGDDDDDDDETKMSVRYVALNGRKCRPYGGTVHEKGTVRVDDFPPVVRRLMERVAASVWEIDGGESSGSLASSSSFQPNHALVNVYDFERGDGIMPHEDGPLYRDCVCIVSIGASCVLTFRPKEMKSATGPDDETPTPNAEFGAETNPRERLPFDVFVPSRSLLVFTKAVYTEYLHGIESRESDARSNPLLLNPEDFPDDDAPRRGRRISITIREVVNLRRGLEFLTKRLTK